MIRDEKWVESVDGRWCCVGEMWMVEEEKWKVVGGGRSEGAVAEDDATPRCCCLESRQDGKGRRDRGAFRGGTCPVPPAACSQAGAPELNESRALSPLHDADVSSGHASAGTSSAAGFSHTPKSLCICLMLVDDEQKEMRTDGKWTRFRLTIRSNQAQCRHAWLGASQHLWTPPLHRGIGLDTATVC